MLRKFIFVDTETGQEIILPVTPEGYEIPGEQDVQIVNLTQFGDYALAGYPSIRAFALPQCLFPAQNYPFLVAGGVADPNFYIQFFRTARDERHLVRFVVSDTAVSMEVLISSFSFGEQDGTNDVYAAIELTPYRRLQAAQETRTDTSVTVVTEGAARASDAPQTTQEAHIVQHGDTLWGLCRKYYGDGALYPRLAKYNGIKNPDLIYDGDTILLPPRDQL